MHHTPLYTCPSSYINVRPKIDHSELSNIQIQHCLAQHLAQVDGPRSGETLSLRRVSPPPRRGHQNRNRNNAGSCLGETPLAWASCLLVQNHTLVTWATTRAGSPRRAPAHLAWARQAPLGETISVRHCLHLHNAYTHPTDISSQFKHP